MRAQFYFTAVLAVFSQIALINASSRRDLLQVPSDGSNQALIVAVSDSNLSAVKKLLDPRSTKPAADVDSKNAVGSTPLMIAAASNSIDILKVLLKSGAQVDLQNDDGFAAMHFVTSGKAATQLFQSQSRLDLEVRTNRGATPLYIATQNGRIEVMKALIDQGAEVDAEFRSTGAPPLLVAGENGDVRALRVLLDEGATVDKGNTNEVTALHLAASIKNGGKAVNLLLDHGLAVDITDKWGDTPLDYAAYFGNEAMVDLLLDRGAEMAKPDVRENLPLRSVCRCEDAEGSPAQLQCPEGNCSERAKANLQKKLDPEQAVEEMPVAESPSTERKGGPWVPKQEDASPEVRSSFLSGGCLSDCRSLNEYNAIDECLEQTQLGVRGCLAKDYPVCKEDFFQPLVNGLCSAEQAEELRQKLSSIYFDCRDIDLFDTQCLLETLHSRDDCTPDEKRCQDAVVDELGREDCVHPGIP
ncbi:hypothetical protein BSKO_00502 [Bryopsis sp. KO-2023]|nr:hypothetical protein BSKO_00502 [Bryopsis sp. KO-2023]